VVHVVAFVHYAQFSKGLLHGQQVSFATVVVLLVELVEVDGVAGVLLEAVVELVAAVLEDDVMVEDTLGAALAR
jgi:hypothetical protein